MVLSGMWKKIQDKCDIRKHLQDKNWIFGFLGSFLFVEIFYKIQKFILSQVFAVLQFLCRILQALSPSHDIFNELSKADRHHAIFYLVPTIALQ